MKCKTIAVSLLLFATPAWAQSAKSDDCWEAYDLWGPHAKLDRTCAWKPMDRRCTAITRRSVVIFTDILKRCEGMLNDKDLRNAKSALAVAKKSLAGGYSIEVRGSGGGAAPRQGLSDRGIPCSVPSERMLGGC